MIEHVPAATLLGVEGHRVRVEVHVGSGLPGFTVVGLPDASCREARDRVRAAVLSSGLDWPNRKVTVNLAPTHLRKVGPGLDLAIAVAVLAASDQVRPRTLDGLAFLGELGLDGSVRGVVGLLALLDAVPDLVPVVAPSGLAEAHLVRADARGIRSLSDLLEVLEGRGAWSSPPPTTGPPPVAPREPDLAEVQGQAIARAALEVAAAGSHHLLMTGPPGAGKTMLAERLPGLLPDLDDRAALAVSRVHSAAAQLRVDRGLLRRPPMRCPHHTSSLVALVGGGSTLLRPGEVSLASSGVLFLDELGEFPAAHLDALRQPLESGVMRVARAATSVTLPAQVLLVAATNPCPCGLGRWGDCTCTPAQLARYRRRLSGPLIDRFDLRLEVDPPDPASVLDPRRRGEATAAVRARVDLARRRAAARGVAANRMLSADELDLHAPLDGPGRSLLRDALEAGRLTMRGAQRVRAVALTLADLSGEDRAVGRDLLGQAMMLRGGDDAAVPVP